MQGSIKETVDLFVANKESIQNAFSWDSGYMHPLCGLIYSSAEKQADVNRMKEADVILKKEFGAFSEFRGNVRMALITQMSLVDDMLGFLQHIQSVYNLLNQKKIFGSEYRIIAAMVIAQNNTDGYTTDEQCVEKTNNIFERMKENHPWLTSDEDMGFAALLAMSGLEVESVIVEMEDCYQKLKSTKKFSSANGLQSLSHVLALQIGDSIEKCNRVVSIYDGLKAQKKKYGCTYELSTLGGLALTNVDVNVLISEIAEVDEYLKTKKGFGAFGIGSTQRLMYAAMMVMQQYAPKNMNVEATALSGIVSLIIAQEVAMMAAISASITANTVN